MNEISALLRLNLENVFCSGDPLSQDLSEQHFDELTPRLESIARNFQQQRSEGKLAFMELHKDSQLLVDIEEFAADIAGKYEDVVVLGIGGSALGAKAVFQALEDLYANFKAPEARQYPRLFVLDNVDPASVAQASKVMNLKKTLAIVITKSGGTLETMSGLLYFVELLRAVHGEQYTRHLVAVTDPEKGYLRKLATDLKLRSFPVPPRVGGRFSVFSAVGLVPLAAVGIDVRGLLEGQKIVVDAFDSGPVTQHPAGQFGALGYLADTVGRRNMLVTMPYSDHLRESAFWFKQLWAESLGKARKLDGSEARVGTTPVFASGATDQHSQVQLYIEGPADKLIVFFELANPVTGEDVKLPAASGPFEELGYLAGRSFHELLHIELNATRDALTDAGKPNATFVLPSITPQSIGAFFCTMMMATAVAGELYGINTFDQPGVEHAKVKIKKALGI